MKSGSQPATAACERAAAMVRRALESVKAQLETRTESAPAGSLARGRTALDPHVQQLRYALGILDQRLAPALAAPEHADPPHVAVLGATNTGKSTVINLLLGRAAAGMSELARFSQHPVAFTFAGLDDGFLTQSETRFSGYERYRQALPPRQSDPELAAAGYRHALGHYTLPVVAEPSIALAPPVALTAVYWDVPDFSTEASLAYMDAVLDTAALADLVLMVVTGESYANAVDQQLRSLVAAAGLPMRVIVNKLQGGALFEDIARQLGAAGPGAVAQDHIHPLPLVPAQGGEHVVLENLARSVEAEALRQVVADDLADARMIKRLSLRQGVAFLVSRREELLAPLQHEADAAQRWVEDVGHVTEREFYGRYREAYLDGRHYADFNLAFLKALDMLEVPGVGQVLAATARFFRGLTQFAWRFIASPFGRTGTDDALSKEQQVIGQCYTNWLTELHRLAQQMAEQRRHPEWRRLANRLGEAEFQNGLATRLGPAWEAHREHVAGLVEIRARAIYAQIEAQPALRHTLRTVKFTADTLAVGGVVLVGGLDPTDFIIGPGVAALLRLLYEKGGEQLARTQERKLKDEQLAALRRVINAHLVTPTRALFQASVSQAELDQARADFAALREAIHGIIGP